MASELGYLAGGLEHFKGRVLEVYNPYSHELVAKVYRPDLSITFGCLEDAKEGFSKASALPSWERYRILSRIAQKIEDTFDTFVEVIIKEAGKPRKYAEAEVKRAIQTFSFAADLARSKEETLLSLDVRPGTEKRLGLVKRFPIGIVMAITPFNFPLNLVAHKYAPNILAGNAIIHKPASATPISSLLLAKIIWEVGYPPQALSVLPFSASDAEQVLQSPTIKALTFTGSAEVGWHLKSLTPEKKVLLELGGDAAVIIAPDYPMEEKNFQQIVEAAMAYAGQVCISVQRVLIHKSQWKTYVEAFVETTKQVFVGDPSDSKTIVGPIIDEANTQRILDWIKEAEQEGAQVLLKPERLDKNLLTPAVLTDVPVHVRLAKEEAFAPVFYMVPYEDIEEAFDIVNQSVYGLQAAIYTHLEHVIKRAYERLEVGGVIVNAPPTFRVDHMPYGGVKRSGFGREGIRYAWEELTEPRLLVW